MDTVTTAQQAPTELQVLAAQARIKADKRLGRDSPADIKKIAAHRRPARAESP